jgi:hypothetical protein
MDAGVWALQQVYSQRLHARPLQLLWVSTTYPATLFACTEAVYLSTRMHAQCAELVCRYPFSTRFHAWCVAACLQLAVDFMLVWMRVVGMSMGRCICAELVCRYLSVLAFMHEASQHVCSLSFNFMLVCAWMRSVSKSFCLKLSQSHLTIKYVTA